MANLIIKPSASGSLILQDEGGDAAITVGTTGNTTLAGTANALGTVASGTLGSSVTWAGSVVKKIHYHEFATETAGTSSASNQFAFVGTFTPLDPVNNSFLVSCDIPTWQQPQGSSGSGIRFDGGNAGDFDYYGRGIDYRYTGASYQVAVSFSFNVPANDLAVGGYTVYYRTESTSSHSNYYCPDSGTDSRLITQTRATLKIIEYKN